MSCHIQTALKRFSQQTDAELNTQLAGCILKKANIHGWNHNTEKHIEITVRVHNKQPERICQEQW